MATEQMYTSLPTVGSAQMTDIICAVQGYVSPSVLGTSVQETLQQVYNLFQAGIIQTYAGNPNGFVAGQTYNLLWDSADKYLWVCTTTGTAGTAVWTLPIPGPLGAATATSITFSPSTGGIVGTTTNNNASAGFVGEFISSVISSGAAVSFTSTVSKDLTSISLTAGDWEVFGNITWNGTTITAGYVWISATSATLPDSSIYNVINPLATSAILGMPAPFFRASLASTTTIYISGQVAGTGSLVGSGGVYARRVR